ncbi:unnamed protein product [Musa acuminata subsp. malaccensis]|uniref:(wild Malaysian banana) hypothetical protein n=1 Tax=Musa acuminata subsp. malaccensis TaxID=214687 RepID=A0A804KVY2_MUSAM|nr:PREDICTED: fructokinase-like 1, chloroplastic [Musa acuminata subsp. malaccensis]CAG1853459.1 unnamed protein product [Musa acuminata subsp. malaccensis]
MAASFHLLSSNTFTIPSSVARRGFDADRKLFHKFPNRDPFSLPILSPAGVPKPLHRETTTWRASLVDDAGNGAMEAPKPTRRGRKKKSADSSPATPVKRTRRRSQKKTPEDEAAAEGPRMPEEAKAPTVAAPVEEEEEEDFDDGMDFPYESPPLVCCFGAARREFVPTVRVSERQMHPDQYSSWKQLQWSPPEFVRAPGGPPSNVAISHARLGGRAAFMGKVGDDDFGNDLVYRMNLEKVQTRAVKIDPAVRTAASHMKIELEDRDDGSGKRLVAKTVKHCAEDSFLKSEIDVAVLKEARIFHFNSEVLLSPAMQPALFWAIKLSKKYNSNVFFDLNLPLSLWRSRDETREVINKAWSNSDLIEVSRQEMEFLLDEEYYERKRNYRPQYYSESYEQTKNRRDYHHYTRKEIAPLWHDGLKILFVTDGTLRIHYYTPKFDGAVVGTEDVLITPFTCDRTGSGDAVVAAIMRKLTIHPEMYEDQDMLERHLRFAVAAGIISQWTIGAVRGFPTESATQNLKEQVYVPSMW